MHSISGWTRKVFLLAFGVVVLAAPQRARADDLKLIGTAPEGIEFHFALNRPNKGCTYGAIKNISKDKLEVKWGYEATSESGARKTVSEAPDSGWILGPGQQVGGWAAILWCPFNKPVGDAPVTEKMTTFRVFNVKIRNISREEREKELARQQEEQRRLDEQRLEEQKRQQEERQRQEQQLREEEQRRREAAESQRRDQQDQSGQQSAQTGGGTGPSGGAAQGGGSGGDARGGQAVQQLGGKNRGAAPAAVTAGLAAGVGLAAVGAMTEIDDGVTPFEIEGAVTIGALRGGLLVGGRFELHRLMWKPYKPIPGETLDQTIRRLEGHELYAVGEIGGMFAFWRPSNCPLCSGNTEVGSVLYGELGYRYWKRWLGFGGFVVGIKESTTDEAAVLDGDMPENRPGASFGGEVLAALGRGSRKVSGHAGLRLYPIDPGLGLIFRMGFNRMHLLIDLSKTDIGGFSGITGFGLRFGL